MNDGLARITLRAGLVAVLAALPWLLDRALAVPAAHRLDHATFGIAFDDERAQARGLPHRWHEDCRNCLNAWYRFDPGEPPAVGEERAFVVPAQGENAAVYLNSRLIGQGGRFADPVARPGPRPLFVSLPAAAWHDDGNRLYVLVRAGRARDGFMSAPALGPAEALQRIAWWRESFAATLPHVVTTAAVMLGLVIGGIALRRRETDYRLYAIAAFAWAPFAFGRLLVDVPWPARIWDASLSAAACLAAAGIVPLALRLGGSEVGRRLRLAAALAGGTMLLVFAVGALEPSGDAPDLVMAISFAAIAGAASWLTWRSFDRSVLLVAAATMCAAAAVHDLLLAVDASAPEAMPSLPLAVPLLFAAAGWGLLLRFVNTLDAAELFNVNLEALVQARTTELGIQLERVRELERERAVVAERERLMRDMHDGVGGHLVSMLAMLEADQHQPDALARVAQQALDDMRLMIDSLEPVNDDLNAVLAMLHDRLEPRLRAAGITLDWDVDLLPLVPGLTPSRVLHVLRMLQETVTNAVRHGAARMLRVATVVHDDAIDIEVSDNGIGFDPAAVHAGRGLVNLRRRAAELDAKLDVRSTPGGGTRVSLRLLRRSSEA